jgi:hypothetical protein
LEFSFKTREIKNGKFLVDMREDSCYKSMRQSHVMFRIVHASNKCIPLTSHFPSHSFLFSVFPSLYVLFFFLYSHIKSQNRAKNRVFLSRAVLRLYSASITWKTWKTHSVRFHVSYRVDVTLVSITVYM